MQTEQAVDARNRNARKMLLSKIRDCLDLEIAVAGMLAGSNAKMSSAGTSEQNARRSSCWRSE